MSKRTSEFGIVLLVLGFILISTGTSLWWLPGFIGVGNAILVIGMILIIIGVFYFKYGRGDEADYGPEPTKEKSETKTTTPVEGPEEFVPEVLLPHPGEEQLPIETVEGIGKAYGDKLREGSIEWVEDLALTTPENVMKLTGVNQLQAQKWIAMARLTWLDDVSNEDAECIVLGANITSIEELAVADPDDLYNKVSTAEKFGRVQVPQGYAISKDKVRKWIASAQKEMPE
ncbi:MAG: DUF4332 domain-containing protein [Candidatus Hermodarchaeota archaeon]|nr:DUF4332 domain-containing protein [Candidatus Hermodarchaeota archaeon]